MSMNHILFVDDNPGDLELVGEALKESGKGTELHVVSDGEEALRFLRRADPFAMAPRPKVVLLDLNMPRKDGIETLKDIRADDGLKDIPVVIFSSSMAPGDRREAELYKANDYIIKPADLVDFIRVIHTIETVWCT